MEKLIFTTVTDRGESREIEFLLHEETSSAQNVSVLVTELLNTISAQVKNGDDLKDGDILQALTMVIAIRCGMLGVEYQIIERLIHSLFRKNIEAVLSAKKGYASRA